MKIKSIALTLLAVVLVGCGGSGSSSSTTAADICNELSNETFSCDDMLTDLVVEGVVPLAQDLETKLADLDAKMTTYCEDIENAEKLTSAQAAWAAAMAPLQQLQVMNFGPNINVETGLLPLYDWQTASRSFIDLAIATNAIASESKLSRTDNEKDLVAVEYILFDYAAVQADQYEDEITEAWRTGKTGTQAQQDAQIQQDRCDYAKLVTSSLKAHGESLSEAWQQYDLLASSSTPQAAANKVAEALFYIDKITKDEKIKTVLPQADDNESAFNAAVLESQFAKQSKEAILNNLVGAKRIFTSNDTDDSKTGIDDYLKAAGQQDTADAMLAALDAAITNVTAIDGLSGTDNGTIYSAVENASNESECTSASGNGTYLANSSDIVTFCALQYQVKTLTDLLKGDFTFLTSFTVPASASGDND